MAARDANPDNLPCSQFQDFRLSGGSVHSTETLRIFGKLADIRAHDRSRGMIVRYAAIRDIETLRGDQPRGVKTRFAVSFSAVLNFHDPAGGAYTWENAPAENLSRIMYWNLTEKDFHGLNFLRHDGDKALFIAACHKADIPLAVATRHLPADPEIAATAFDRALRLLKAAADISEDEMRLFAAYIGALLKKDETGAADEAIGFYRALDRCGEAADALVPILLKAGRPPQESGVLLEEAAARLLRTKPKAYSQHLYAVLHSVLKYRLETPKAAPLLWQTYLAATSEREIEVLKRIWLRAVEMRADQETLDIIKKTWRGFAPPRPRIAAETNATGKSATLQYSTTPALQSPADS